jgi:hypothetical protein
MKKQITPNNIVIYQTPSGAIELRGDFSHETVWGTRMQMAEIFGVNPQAVGKHIHNIYKEGELAKDATSSKMELVQTDGKDACLRIASLKTENRGALAAIVARNATVQ